MGNAVLGTGKGFIALHGRIEGAVAMLAVPHRLIEGVVVMEKASLFASLVAFASDRGSAWQCVSVWASKSSKTRSSSEIDGGSTMPPVAKEVASFNPD
mmetsp:Transcript_54080/g.128892  ORF Transcript_54080/g.128892 Transcript_54080/m.128892 type:complete len:98 (+) Transcript_54080:253-546(+)